MKTETFGCINFNSTCSMMTEKKLPKKLQILDSKFEPNICNFYLIFNNFMHSFFRSLFDAEGSDWIGYWGKHMKAENFKAIQPHQKVREKERRKFIMYMCNRLIICLVLSKLVVRTGCGETYQKCRHTMGKG